MLFETRYFWALFAENDTDYVNRFRSVFERSKRKVVSSVTIYEIHKLALESEGETVAQLRVNTIKKDFNCHESGSAGGKVEKVGTNISKEILLRVVKYEPRDCQGDV